MANNSRSIWAEPLPDDCPHSDAQTPNGDVVYRLTSAYPPIEKDFFSQSKLHPERKFKDECIARALSVHNSLAASKNVQKLPSQKENRYIVKLTLTNNSGVIKQTGKDINHISWWQKRNFNPLEHCELFGHTENGSL
ncbi:MAG: hypothetical protein WA821_12265 [Anaerolineales bacterium]